MYMYKKWESEKGNTGLADVYRALYCNFLYILYVFFFFVMFKTAVLFDVFSKGGVGIVGGRGLYHAVNSSVYQ